MSQIVFGPVPSRRLGKSIGVNHIPPKVCSYACVYCQLGKAIRMDHISHGFYDWEEVVKEIKNHVAEIEKGKEHIDYIAFVPDGEPTLDKNLGKILHGIHDLPYKKAVITNGSLLNIPEVRAVLYNFDWVSIKVDAITEQVWQKIDHPHRKLNLDDIHQGILEFAAQYTGALVSETMLIEGLNTGQEELLEIANFLSKLKPSTAYIAIPTRTPAHKNVKPANENQINRAFQIFSEKLNKIECLIGHEGDDFAHTGNAKSDILSITAVHPMREDSLKYFLKEASETWSLVDDLLKQELLLETEFNGNRFYVRKLKESNQY